MFERSRVATSTSAAGLLLNQATRLSWERSGSRSTTSWRSRFTRIVPYVLPFLKAKSSTPSTLTFPTSGKGTALILLSKASRAATMPSSRASLALQGDRQQGLLKHHGLAGAGSDLLKPLAEEAPRQDLELDGDAVPGQIRDRAKVAAVHPRGSATAQRADAS